MQSCWCYGKRTSIKSIIITVQIKSKKIVHKHFLRDSQYKNKNVWFDLTFFVLVLFVKFSFWMKMVLLKINGIQIVNYRSVRVQWMLNYYRKRLSDGELCNDISLDASGAMDKNKSDYEPGNSGILLFDRLFVINWLAKYE